MAVTCLTKFIVETKWCRLIHFCSMGPKRSRLFRKIKIFFLHLSWHSFMPLGNQSNKCIQNCRYCAAYVPHRNEEVYLNIKFAWNHSCFLMITSLWFSPCKPLIYIKCKKKCNYILNGFRFFSEYLARTKSCTKYCRVSQKF